MRTGSILLTIDSQLDNVFLVGLAVNEICRVVLPDEVNAYQAELCVVEAVTNAIKHAYKGEPGHRVELTLAVEEDGVVFRVCDTGVPMPQPLDTRAAAKNPPLLAESGRGLFIISAAMDEVSYVSHEGTNVLTMVKRFHPTPSNARPLRVVGR